MHNIILLGMLAIMHWIISLDIYHHSSCNVRLCCRKKLQRSGLIPQRPKISPMYTIGYTSGDLTGHASALTPLLSHQVDSNTGWVWACLVLLVLQSFHQCAGQREQLPGTVNVEFDQCNVGWSRDYSTVKFLFLWQIVS